MTHKNTRLNLIFFYNDKNLQNRQNSSKNEEKTPVSTSQIENFTTPLN